MDLRNRDIRYTEVLLFTTVLELLGNSMLSVLMAGLRVEAKGPMGFTRERLDQLMLIYRDKLFHNGYLPDYEKRLNEVLSGKSGTMREKTQQDIENLRKVALLTDDDPL